MYEECVPASSPKSYYPAKPDQPQHARFDIVTLVLHSSSEEHATNEKGSDGQQEVGVDFPQERRGMVED